MKKNVLFLAGILAVALTGFFSTACELEEETEAPYGAFELRVFELTNVERVKEGLPRLKWDNGLAAVARAHSEDMAQNGYFAHTSPDGSSTLISRLAKAGIKYSSAAENICGGRSTPEATVKAWMDSPGHKANILDGALTHLGVGVAYLQSSPLRYYATQLFTVPK